MRMSCASDRDITRGGLSPPRPTDGNRRAAAGARLEVAAIGLVDDHRPRSAAIKHVVDSQKHIPTCVPPRAPLPAPSETRMTLRGVGIAVVGGDIADPPTLQRAGPAGIVGTPCPFRERIGARNPGDPVARVDYTGFDLRTVGDRKRKTVDEARIDPARRQRITPVRADVARGSELDALAARRARIGETRATATIEFGIRYPGRALSLTVAGGGGGGSADPEERKKFAADCASFVFRFEMICSAHGLRRGRSFCESHRP